jgi:hypothetical protein
MRAGMAVKFEELTKWAWPTALLCVVPYFAEFITFMYAGQSFFNWPIVDMGLWASIMAPLSPALVISSMLILIADKIKDHGYVPKQVLAAAPIESTLAIVLFGIFVSICNSRLFDFCVIFFSIS